MSGDPDFDRFAARKAAAADAAVLPQLRTLINRAARLQLVPLGDAWCYERFDGPFWTSPVSDRPAISIVFVQSRNGNTVTDDPSSLGAGDADTHLIYEGLSRVAVDGVAVGTRTLHRDSFFSVWRRELVEARAARGLPRHPAQIVLARDGQADIDNTRLFNVPDVPVYVLTSRAGRDRLAHSLEVRPWVRPIVADGPGALDAQVDELFRLGQRRISCVGGRLAASSLVDAGLARDLYLTTSPRDGGAPHTPWYAGNTPLLLDRVLAKSWQDVEGVVRFDHFAIHNHGSHGNH